MSSTSLLYDEAESKSDMESCQVPSYQVPWTESDEEYRRGRCGLFYEQADWKWLEEKADHMVRLLKEQLEVKGCAIIYDFTAEQAHFFEQLGYGQKRSISRKDSLAAQIFNCPDFGFVIQDAPNESNCLANFYVQNEPHIKFFCCTPLKTPCGQIWGTFEVWSDKPLESTMNFEMQLVRMCLLIEQNMAPPGGWPTIPIDDEESSCSRRPPGQPRVSTVTEHFSNDFASPSCIPNALVTPRIREEMFLGSLAVSDPAIEASFEVPEEMRTARYSRRFSRGSGFFEPSIPPSYGRPQIQSRVAHPRPFATPSRISEEDETEAFDGDVTVKSNDLQPYVSSEPEDETEAFDGDATILPSNDLHPYATSEPEDEQEDMDSTLKPVDRSLLMFKNLSPGNNEQLLVNEQHMNHQIAKQQDQQDQQQRERYERDRKQREREQDLQRDRDYSTRKQRQEEDKIERYREKQARGIKEAQRLASDEALAKRDYVQSRKVLSARGKSQGPSHGSSSESSREALTPDQDIWGDAIDPTWDQARINVHLTAQQEIYAVLLKIVRQTREIEFGVKPGWHPTTESQRSSEYYAVKRLHLGQKSRTQQFVESQVGRSIGRNDSHKDDSDGWESVGRTHGSQYGDDTHGRPGRVNTPDDHYGYDTYEEESVRGPLAGSTRNYSNDRVFEQRIERQHGAQISAQSSSSEHSTQSSGNTSRKQHEHLQYARTPTDERCERNRPSGPGLMGDFSSQGLARDVSEQTLKAPTSNYGLSEFTRNHTPVINRGYSPISTNPGLHSYASHTRLRDPSARSAGLHQYASKTRLNDLGPGDPRQPHMPRSGTAIFPGGRSETPDYNQGLLSNPGPSNAYRNPSADPGYGQTTNATTPVQAEESLLGGMSFEEYTEIFSSHPPVSEESSEPPQSEPQLSQSAASGYSERADSGAYEDSTYSYEDSTAPNGDLRVGQYQAGHRFDSQPCKPDDQTLSFPAKLVNKFFSSKASSSSANGSGKNVGKEEKKATKKAADLVKTAEKKAADAAKKEAKLKVDADKKAAAAAKKEYAREDKRLRNRTTDEMKIEALTAYRDAEDERWHRQRREEAGTPEYGPGTQTLSFDIPQRADTWDTSFIGASAQVPPVEVPKRAETFNHPAGTQRNFSRNESRARMFESTSETSYYGSSAQIQPVEVPISAETVESPAGTYQDFSRNHSRAQLSDSPRCIPRNISRTATRAEMTEPPNGVPQNLSRAAGRAQMVEAPNSIPRKLSGNVIFQPGTFGANVSAGFRQPSLERPIAPWQRGERAPTPEAMTFELPYLEEDPVWKYR